MMWTIALPMSAILAVLLFWLIFKDAPEKIQHLAINPKPYIQVIKKKEIGRTLISFIVFAITGGIMDYFAYMGWSNVYYGESKYGLGYLILSLFLLFAINDVYFYLSHRFLHWKPIFKRIHFIHHQSHTSNPFSAFSFHPLEGFIQVAFLPFIVLFLPVNAYLLVFYIAFLMLMSVYGHSGYELRPNKAKVFEIFNNSIHHNQHHKFVHYNYGLYLNLWDRIFNTNHPSYDMETESLKKQNL